MKKYIYIVAALSVLFTGCYDDLSEQTHNNLQSLKDVEIATVKEQVASITTSVGTIQTLSAELEKYIEKLQDVNTGLETDYEALSLLLDAVKAELQNDMDGAKAAMLSGYESAKNTLENKIAEINAVLSFLQDKKKELDSRADKLKKDLDENYATTDWVKATLATIDSQEKVADEVAAVKAHVDELTKSLEETEKELDEMLKSKLEEMKDKTDSKLYSEYEKLIKAYTDAIAEASAGVNAAFDAALKEAINNSQDKLIEWVSGQFDGYFTIAEKNAKVEAFRTLVGSVHQNTDVQSEIDALLEAFSNAKEEIKEAYETAITEAINRSGKVLDETIIAQISKIEDEVAALSTRVDALEIQVKDIIDKIGELTISINTIDEQIAAIKASISVLDKLDVTLEEYIADIKKDLKDDDTKYFNEVKALIDALDGELEGLQARITALTSYVGKLPSGAGKDNVADWVKTTAETIKEQLNTYCSVTEVDEIIKLLNETATEHGKQISTYSETLKGLVDKAKDTIDGWIDEALVGYHKAAQIDADLLTLKTKLEVEIDTKDSEIGVAIAKLETDYDNTVAKFIEYYKNAITEAITKNQGTVDNEFTVAIASAESQINALKARVTAMEKDIEQLIKDIAAIKADVSAMKEDVGDLEAFIKDSGYGSLQKFVDYLNDELKKCETDYLTIADLKALKALIYGEDLTGETSGLKFWIDQMDVLTERLETAEGKAGELEAFFAGFDFEGGDTLVGKLGEIKTALAKLKGEVDGDGTEEKPGLQEMIDKINEALYGKGNSRETATEGSICWKLQKLIDNTIASTFSSITYMPTSSDGSISKGTNTLEFIIRPAELAGILGEGNCKLELIGGSINKVSGNKETGILTVNCNVTGNWVSLQVEVEVEFEKEEGTEKHTLEFTSQYIPVKE